jgi:LysM repeat protein
MTLANIRSDEFTESLSSSTNITTLQFLTWNPNLIGLCTNTTSQYVCVSAPGGTYIPPDVSNSTTNDGSQQRGGGDGSGTSTGSGGVSGSSRNSTTVKLGQPAPSPTQSGISSICTQYGEAESGDGCYSFSQLFDITEEALYEWNTILGPDGENCTTVFYAGYYYCIGVSGSLTTSTTTSSITSSPTTSSVPSPVQSGIDAQCTSYSEAASGEYCSIFATENNITTTELYVWNPILGTNGVNCGTAFYAGYYYCVGAPEISLTTSSTASPTTTSSTTSTTAAVPSPTQTGIASNCNAYAEAVSGDSCYGFAQEHGITTTNLYTWNTILGTDGANCGTALYAGYYYCIGVSS